MKRASDWHRDEARAIRALRTGEWWNGRMWRPSTAHPRTVAEAANYRSALDRLGEILDAMLGTSSEAASLRAATRFSQSANARAKKDPARQEESGDVWETLVARFGEDRLLKGGTPNELLDQCVEELERGRFKTRKGETWLRSGVKSFLRRRQRRL